MSILKTKKTELTNLYFGISSVVAAPVIGASSSNNWAYAGRTILGEDHAGLLNLAYDLTLTKTLYSKELQAQIGQVDSLILQAKANLEADREDLFLKVADTYFQFLNDIHYNLRNSHHATEMATITMPMAIGINTQI